MLLYGIYTLLHRKGMYQVFIIRSGTGDGTFLLPVTISIPGKNNGTMIHTYKAVRI